MERQNRDDGHETGVLVGGKYAHAVVIVIPEAVVVLLLGAFVALAVASLRAYREELFG